MLRAARSELAAVGALLVLAVGVLSFMEIADDVAEGDTRGVDRWILLMLRDPDNPAVPLGGRWVREAVGDITALGGWTVLTLFVLLLVGLFASLRRWREAALLLVAAMGGTALGQALKGIFGRERPDEAWRLVEAANASFPSGHAMMSAVVYLTLGALVARFANRRRVKWFAIGVGVLLTAMVGVSRIYLGVHWPSDVLAGWCVGAAWAMACWLGVWAVEKWWRKDVERAPQG
ncbi:MAG TPA: phosphatase PAP2 family protein [Caulobacter sp.]|nr:phosphatase PAP2 family protein [Caulobacter sp.]